MKKIIIEQEYESLKKDPRLKWAAIITISLFVIALIMGLSYYKTNDQINSKAQNRTYSQWLNQGEKNPHSAAHYGLYAYKPVPLMAVIDKGMDEYLGNAVWLEAHNQNEVKLKYIQDAGSLARFNSLTIGFVWQYLLPLVIILLSFNSVSKEYESGRLRILLSTNINTSTLVISKTISILKVILVWLFLPMLLISIVAMIFVGSFHNFKVSFIALLCMIIFYLFYCLLYVMLGVFVSTKLKSSARSLLILLGFWAISGFLIPRISGNIAKQIHPTLSSFDFTEAILKEREKGSDGKGSYELFQKQLQEKVLKEYGVDSISQLPVSFAGLSLQAGEERDWKVYDKHYGQLFQTFYLQDKCLEYFNIFSPTLAMRNLSRAFSSTDMNKHIDFTNKAETHRRLIAQLMNGDQTKNGIGKERGYKAGNDLWQKVPQFNYVTPSVSFIIKNQLLSIAGLTIWIFVIGLMLLRSAKKLSPI